MWVVPWLVEGIFSRWQEREEKANMKRLLENRLDDAMIERVD
jgi:hypothetical protein